MRCTDEGEIWRVSDVTWRGPIASPFHVHRRRCGAIEPPENVAYELTDKNLPIIDEWMKILMDNNIIHWHKGLNRPLTLALA